MHPGYKLAFFVGLPLALMILAVSTTPPVEKKQ
jgi:hypothetical protein